MPKFVIEREVPGAGNLTDAQLRELSQKSANVLKGMGPEIQWRQTRPPFKNTRDASGFRAIAFPLCGE